MSKSRRSRQGVPSAGTPDMEMESIGAERSSALEENVQAIKRWEGAILRARSSAARFSDWIACTAGSGPVLVLHVVWFGAWVTVNAGALRVVRPFDPFPFPFLTMTVSLEAIFWHCSSSPARTDCTPGRQAQSSRPADRFAGRARDDGHAATAAGHRAPSGRPDHGYTSAVARPHEADGPRTLDGPNGGARGTERCSLVARNRCAAGAVEDLTVLTRGSAQRLQFATSCSILCPSRGLNSRGVPGERCLRTMSWGLPHSSRTTSFSPSFLPSSSCSPSPVSFPLTCHR